MAFRFNMNTAVPFPAPEVTRLPNEASLTNPFDWLLLLGFPAEAAGRSLGLAPGTGTSPSTDDDPPPREAA